MGYAKSFLYNGGDILHGGTQNFSYIVGVRYINASIPIHIGEIMRRGMQNLSTPTQNLSYILGECISN